MDDRGRKRLLHDLKQPVTAIMNFANAGSRMTEGDADRESLKSVFERIQEQAERLADLCLQEETDNVHADAQQRNEGTC